METNITRTFAALSATNEAILYAKSPEELYEQVSKAAFSSGDFLATAVFLLEAGTEMLRFAAGFGEDIKRLRRIDISIVANTPEGSGVCGQAFRDQKLCISNDFLNDPRSLAWRQGACDGHVGAAAALPLTCNGQSVGVLLVTMRERRLAERPDRLAARAHVGEYFLCARQFRSRGGAGAAVADVCGAQRDQRGDRAGQVARRNCSSWSAMPRCMARSSIRRRWRSPGPAPICFMSSPRPGSMPARCGTANSRSPTRCLKGAALPERRSGRGSLASATTFWPMSEPGPGMRVRAAAALHPRRRCRWSAAIAPGAC